MNYFFLIIQDEMWNRVKIKLVNAMVRDQHCRHLLNSPTNGLKTT